MSVEHRMDVWEGKDRSQNVKLAPAGEGRERCVWWFGYVQLPPTDAPINASGRGRRNVGRVKVIKENIR